MESGFVLQELYLTLTLTAKLLLPLLATSLFVGLLISLFQAVTQINDATLAFLPKLVAVAIVLWFAWPWLTQEMVTYTTHTFEMMQRVSR